MWLILESRTCRLYKLFVVILFELSETLLDIRIKVKILNANKIITKN